MEDKDRDYSNKDITVHWKPAKCIHVTTCYKELIEVFNPRNRPWVNMEGAPTDKIIEVVKKCPTGALTFSLNNGTEVTEKKETEETKKDKQADHSAEVKIMGDGPIVVMGDFEITGPRNQTYNKMKMISFCRCGASNNMPFCDGSHRKIGFRG
jgi:uncharacterized Fe-S cluster protein YjdI